MISERPCIKALTYPLPEQLQNESMASDIIYRELCKGVMDKEYSACDTNGKGVLKMGPVMMHLLRLMSSDPNAMPSVAARFCPIGRIAGS